MLPLTIPLSPLEGRLIRFPRRLGLWIDQDLIFLRWPTLEELKLRKAFRQSYRRMLHLMRPLSHVEDRLIHFPRRPGLWIGQDLIFLWPTLEELKLRKALPQSNSRMLHLARPLIPLVTRSSLFPRELEVLHDHHTSLCSTLLKLKLWKAVRQFSQKTLHSRTLTHLARSIRSQRKPKVWAVKHNVTSV